MRLSTRMRMLVGLPLALACANAAHAQMPPDDAPAATLAQVQQETAKLLPRPRTVRLTVEKAQDAVAAIRRGDFAAADAITSQVLATTRLGPWRDHPFDTFIENMTVSNDGAFLARLNAWVDGDPNGAVPHIVRAQYFRWTAWTLRDDRTADDGSRTLGYWTNITRAWVDISAARRLHDDIPYAAFMQLQIVADLQKFGDLEAVFQDAIAAFPDYHQLYRFRLATLSPRRGGSLAQMDAFVERYASWSAPDSPRRMLYLSLYDLTLENASDRCIGHGTTYDQIKICVAQQMNATAPPELEQDVVEALRLGVRTDRYEFGVELARPLGEIINIWGGEIEAGAVLQLAADAVGSDNRLTRDTPGSGNYELDAAVAKVWARNGFYDNAVTKYRHAADDIAAAVFPNEEAYDLALAGVYEHLADIADIQQKDVAVIAYTDAAIALGGYWHNHAYYRACKAYMNLKLYREGIEECDRLIANGVGPGALYWRARIFQAAGDMDRALLDFGAVTDTTPDWGMRAAIDMSLIYGDRKDYRDTILMFNDHPYLFNEAVESKDNLAIVYNNRCYAYMQIGELQKALEDCTASLRFGSLPEAYAKQEDLVKRLRAQAAKAGKNGPT